MDRLAYALTQRAPRERLLLLLLCVLGVPLALYFLAAEPLLNARAAATSAAAEASAMRDWVARQVAALPADTPDAAVAEAPGAPIGLSGLESSLIEAGLRDRVAQLSNAQGGAVDLEFDAVPFEALIAWLHDISGISGGWGYDVAGFRIVRGAPGLVTAGFTLEPAR